MAKAKKPTPAAAPDTPAETPATADAAAGDTPAPASGLSALVRGFISPHMLFLALLVGLVSLAVDYEYLPSRIEPVAIEYDFAPRTLAQQQTYNDGVGRAPITSVFESAERLLEGELLAPEDLAISPDGQKVFAGLRDGRVVYFTTDDKTGALTVHEFGRTGNYQDTCGEPVMEKICGRPLGLAFVDGAAYARYVKRMEDPTFFPDSKMLLVADAYKGLILMDAFGKATKVFDTVGPRRIRFLNSLAVKENGEVYLTDSSRRHYRRDVHLEVLERKPTGRLLHFNPVTTRVSVLATDLSFPNGITLVDDEKALLVALTNQNKLVKFDLKTKKMEDFAFLPGPPDNIWIETSDDNKSKKLFVGLTSLQPVWHLWVMGQPKVRKLMDIAIPPKYLREIASPHGAFVTVDLTSGDVTNVYKSSDGAARFLSGVHGVGDYYYLTTWNQDSITRIPKKAFA